MADEYESDESVDTPGPDAEGEEKRPVTEARRQLVKSIVRKIKDDKDHHKDAFKRMRRDMDLARNGTDDDQWLKAEKYIANITGRHINQKVASLYAKNPRASARLRQRLEYKIWDESEQSLMMALQTIQLSQAAASGQGGPMGPMLSSVAPGALQQAMAVMQDFQQGTQRKEMLRKVGKTLETLFHYYTGEQMPVDFKMQMKQLVRRTATACVGYIKIGFQREYEARPEITSQIADVTDRLNHLRVLAEEGAEGDFGPDDAKAEELRLALESLRQQEMVIVREGLVFDFPQATDVIPDKLCRNLVGFIGARHISLEYKFTREEIRKLFGVDLGDKAYTPYRSDGRPYEESKDWTDGEDGEKGKDPGLVCVWANYDKDSGLVYYVCDGYEDFLQEPEAPDVFVENFWPIYALTFNEVEHPDHLYPPSDVALMRDMQLEYNRSREGLRAHRRSALPRYTMKAGALDDEEKELFRTATPHEIIETNQVDGKIGDIIEIVPVSGVDPNLYETGPLFQDMQLVVGSQEAQFGATSNSTATESAIAQGAQAASTAANVDDLDNFLTIVARASGQILLQEMSPETVTKIVGPGAVWPEFSPQDIAEEIFLEIEAGSSGKPNAAAEIQNWERMLPFLLQMPTIQPTWLARETLRRLDDRMDLADAISESLPSIVAQNSMTQAQPGDATAAPEQQGGEGGDNGPRAPSGPSGTKAAGGNNQV